MNRLQIASLVAVAAAVPVALVGCGSSSSADTAASTGAEKAAAAPCPEMAGAVTQVVTFRNTLDVPVTLGSPEGSACDNSAGQVFSGDKNPSQLDGLELTPGAEATAVTFAGKAGARGSFDLAVSVPGGLKAAAPWPIQVRFGGSDGTGSVLGWEEGYEKFLNGACLDTLVPNDGTWRGMAGVQGTSVTFAPEVASECE